MLAIGRALMSDPSLLLLDEPSTGLAPRLVESIFRTLYDLHRRGTMILLVEQNARVALSVATRAYVMEAGAIVAEGPAAALSKDTRVMEAYLG
jgi:branched-chain amino acid transport system ATP-binding protein